MPHRACALHDGLAPPRAGAATSAQVPDTRQTGSQAAVLPVRGAETGVKKAGWRDVGGKHLLGLGALHQFSRHIGDQIEDTLPGGDQPRRSGKGPGLQFAGRIEHHLMLNRSGILPCPAAQDTAAVQRVPGYLPTGMRWK